MHKIDSNLLSLKLRSFITEFRAQSAAFWFLCFYIFIEYIRPHGMYPVLNFLPWGQLSILLAVSSVFVTGSKARGFGPLDIMFIIISILVLLSGIFAWSPSESFKYWSTYTSWILMYFCIISVITTANRVLLFIIFFLLINFKLSEHGAVSFAMRGFSFAHWGLTGPPGWFRNSGEFAMQMANVFAISLCLLLALRKYIKSNIRWWILLALFPGTAALSVIGSSSRGGQMALMAIMLIIFLKGKNFVRKSLLLTVVIYLGLNLLPPEQLERFNSMGEDQTSQLRLTHWENALEVIDSEPLGIGYYNWKAYYPAHFDVVKIEEIHNTVLQVFVELGYPGGILFLLMIMTTFIMNMRTRQEMEHFQEAEAAVLSALARGINLSLLGTFIAALFMSVLFYPVFWVTFALTSALRHTSNNLAIELAKPVTSSSRYEIKAKSKANRRFNKTRSGNNGQYQYKSKN